MIRRRKDYTGELAPFERRLDSLAKLLSGKSQCAAISVINKKFYITANEFHQNQKKNTQHQILISVIVTYFKDLSKEKNYIGPEENDKIIFKKICLQTAKIQEIASFNIPNNVIENAIEDIIETIWQKKQLIIGDLLKKYSAHAIGVGALHVKILSLSKAFFKIKKSILNGEKDNKIKLTEEQLQAFNVDYELLAIEQEKGVHAEVQLLAYIVSEIKKNDINKNEKKEIYIGISKLCCLNCRIMLEKANEIFATKNILITLRFRGHHDLMFDTNWRSPQIFTEGYEAEKIDEKQDHPIEYLIGYLSKNNIEQLNKLQKPSKVSMHPSESNSENEELTLEESEYDKRLGFLKNQLEFLKILKMNDANNSLPKQIKMVSIAIMLNTDKELHNLLNDLNKIDLATTDDDTLNRTLTILLTNYSQKQKDKLVINEEEFLEILRNSFFVGDKISKRFERFKLTSSETNKRKIGEIYSDSSDTNINPLKFHKPNEDKPDEINFEENQTPTLSK